MAMRVRITRHVLTNKKPLFFFISGKQNHSFIHYNPDYAQSSILSAQFKSKVIKNISSEELMIDFLYTRKPLIKTSNYHESCYMKGG